MSRCPSSSLLALAAGALVPVCLLYLRGRLLQRYAVRLVQQCEVCTEYEVQEPAQAVAN
jgi:hypothetical protein